MNAREILEQQADLITAYVNESIKSLHGDICPVHGIPFLSPGPGCYIECSECRRLNDEPAPHQTRGASCDEV